MKRAEDETVFYENGYFRGNCLSDGEEKMSRHLQITRGSGKIAAQ
jgi:hypothetical protein